MNHAERIKSYLAVKQCGSEEEKEEEEEESEQSFLKTGNLVLITVHPLLDLKYCF